jgi:hypothetical protein
MAEPAGNLTFAIIKPDAVNAGHTGKIIDRIITGGFRIRALKMIQQSPKQAEGFYDVHRGKPFYGCRKNGGANTGRNSRGQVVGGYWIGDERSFGHIGRRIVHRL